MHDTLQCLLRLAGFRATVVDMLLLATTEATVHMGGSGGVSEALARLFAGVAQGCPASAMVFCVVAEAGTFLALLRVPPCWGPGGPFNRLGFLDDTTWCIDSKSDLPLCVDIVYGQFAESGALDEPFCVWSQAVTRGCSL